MGSTNLSSNCEEIGEKRVQKIYFTDHLSSKPDSFVVDMDNISHVMEKDTNANSRITRNLSRKGSARNGEMKITGNERDTANNMITTSPRA
ncbi:hypothetical protein CASFOL_028936 [Castilleja foliolosa]|uniref:Uncharacterized protein n=1 Tax=Castilleja foliolosa TaxID=1961234 RepID=A0ABD3CDC6_9LAMI